MAYFADYYIRYMYDFAPMTGKTGRAIWQLSSQRIPPLFSAKVILLRNSRKKASPMPKYLTIAFIIWRVTPISS